MNTDILVPCAQVFVAEINARWPHRDHASDGSVGNAAHQATNSDHNPGPAGSPSPGKVDAVDIDDDLEKPDDRANMRFIQTRFEAHPSSQYWIYQDRICHRSEGWVPRSYAYAGPNRNRHDKHGHFNFIESKAAHNNRSPFGIEVDMTTLDDDAIAGRSYAQLIKDVHWALFTSTGNHAPESLVAKVTKTAAIVGISVPPPPAPVQMSAEQLDQLAAKVVERLAESVELGFRKATP